MKSFKEYMNEASSLPKVMSLKDLDDGHSIKGNYGTMFVYDFATNRLVVSSNPGDIMGKGYTSLNSTVVVDIDSGIQYLKYGKTRKAGKGTLYTITTGARDYQAKAVRSISQMNDAINRGMGDVVGIDVQKKKIYRINR